MQHHPPGAGLFYRGSGVAKVMDMDLRLIRVLAVDDHPIFRQGIVSLLADHPDMHLVGKRPAVLRPSANSVPTGLT